MGLNTFDYKIVLFDRTKDDNTQHLTPTKLLHCYNDSYFMVYVTDTRSNSSPLRVAYVRQWIESAFVQIMAFHPFTKMHLKISSTIWRPFCPGGKWITAQVMSWPQFYQTRSAWSMDQGSTKKRSAVHNFVPAVTKFRVVWEGLSLPQDTKFGNCRDEIVDRRVIFIWSLIHGSSWSGLIKVGPDKMGTWTF